jgi:hypothetical protein
MTGTDVCAETPAVAMLRKYAKAKSAFITCQSSPAYRSFVYATAGDVLPRTMRDLHVNAREF